MATILKSDSTPAASLYLPKASLDWELGDFIKKNDYDNVAIQTFSLQDEEVLDIRRCFNEINHIFVFGRDISRTILSVSLIILLGDKCSTGTVKGDGSKSTSEELEATEKDNSKSASLEDISKRYDSSRIYVNTSSMTIKIGTFNMKGFLVGLSAGPVDPETFTCRVVVSFIADKEV